MANDWIKMRSSLVTHPKVTAICKAVERSKIVGKKLSIGFGGALCEIVTRDVTRDVTLASLFRVWCAANEHTSDGVWYGIELDDLDHVAGIPGFGSMMEAVGWAVVDVDSQTVTFPNFLEYNAPAKEGRGSSAAERQRRYREKSRTKTDGCDVTRDVTRDVTDTVTRYGKSDVEKRREEKNIREREGEGENRFSETFQTAWDRWKLHCIDKGKPINSVSEEMQLMNLFAAYPDETEAIKAINHSITQNWANINKTNDHNRAREPSKATSGRKTAGQQIAEDLEKVFGGNK